MKKGIGLLLSTVMAGSLLVGCMEKGSNETSSAPASTLKNGKFDPPITITIAKQQDELAGKYLKGESIDDNVLTRWGKDNLGINIKTSLLGGDAGNYNTKLRLALTGAEKLPDVFPVYDLQLISDLIESGTVKDVGTDIKKYMPERLKKIYEQYPTTFNPLVNDGKVYGMAIAPNMTEGEVMLIRQDWLDKLNLEAPTTIEEFENVIAAFTNHDPDGNGKKDTYGFTFSGKDSYNTGWVSDPVMIFSAYTGKNLTHQWNETDGKLSYGSVAEGTKDALGKLSDWYKNGYLNKELGTLGAWDALADFTEGKAGIIIGRPWLYGSVKDVEKNVNGAKIEAYPFIKTVVGETAYQTGQQNDGYFMFNKDFNNMEAFFLYYDKLYDAGFGTGDFKYGYAENYDYDVVNGEVIFDSTKFDPPLTEVQGVGKMSFTKNTPSVDGPGKSFYDLANGAKADTGVLMRSAAGDETMKKGYVISYENRDTLLPGAFNGAPTATMETSWGQLQTMESETFTKIIYGNLPLSAYDEFVKDWNEKGGKKITEEVNEWYKGATEGDIMSKLGLK
jgi:putative aldouronate transport system substrate-binding protein